MNIFAKIFGSSNERTIRKLRKVVAKINALEPQFEKMKDEELRAKTDELRKRVKDGEKLEDLIPEAFANVREASKRVLHMRHFDVQLMGGIVLNSRQIAEMKTGEGKSLTATLPAYLNALTGKGVHIVTVNDYLASRDAEWSKPLFEFLGMTVSCNTNGLDAEAKRAAYACDILYGTNNEFGFDYLRDNLAYSKEQRVQRPLYYALVDEVDSVLIDEARTPLIISGPSEDSSELYRKVDKVIPNLKQQDKEDSETYHGDGDYTIDLKTKQTYLTEHGQIYVEKLLQEAGLLGENDSLFATNNMMILHHVMQALRAHVLFHRDVDYIVQNGEVVIVDEQTGRTMPGRRWSEGLHQAIEAKEGVKINAENQTLASITFQNYFRLYEKLAGMTGTADTEAYEFQQIYGLNTVVIPTNRPMIRIDYPDAIYLDDEDKYEAVVKDVVQEVGKGRPVLIGTVSVENSEKLSRFLDAKGIKHEVLNAKNHAREAEIIAQAGAPKSVTIATNMAGRGTDIVLGGNWQQQVKHLENPTEEQIEEIKKEWQKRHDEVVKAGGLHIIGTERHESRRIDNQLRGRSGRQGDPGSSRFYISFDDSLMKRFVDTEKMKRLFQRIGMQKGDAIENRMVTRSIENAQRKVEARNFDIRKNLIEFDDVANAQRKVIYQQRNSLLDGDDESQVIHDIMYDVINDYVSQFIPPQSLEETWKLPELEEGLRRNFSLDAPVREWLKADDKMFEETLREKIVDLARANFKQKCDLIGKESTIALQKTVMLQCLDQLWKEHLAGMDYLRQGINLRGYAQRNPKFEYKQESFRMFENMLNLYKQRVVQIFCNIQIRSPEEVQQAEEERQRNAQALERKQQQNAAGEGAPEPEDEGEGNEGQGGEQPQPRQNVTVRRAYPKVGRNDPCPCGSGKKYKDCHGRLH